MIPRAALLLATSLVVAAPAPPAIRATSGQQDLPTPGFHHLHLNSLNPEAAIAFYTEHEGRHRRGQSTRRPACRRRRVRVPQGA